VEIFARVGEVLLNGVGPIWICSEASLRNGNETGSESSSIMTKRLDQMLRDANMTSTTKKTYFFTMKGTRCSYAAIRKIVLGLPKSVEKIEDVIDPMLVVGSMYHARKRICYR
jgi:hypothetical protein